MASPRCLWFQRSITLTVLSVFLITQIHGYKSNATIPPLSMGSFLATSSLPSFPVNSAPISPAVQNPLCRSDSMLFLDSLENGTMWAAKMFDSSTKFPTGFFAGSTVDFGNFDQCRSVRTSVWDGDTNRRTFSGKYCLSTLYIPRSKLPATGEVVARIQYTIDSRLHWSLNQVMVASCIPSSCMASDLKAHLKHVIPKLDQLKSLGIPVDDVEVFVNDKACSALEDGSNLSAGKIATLSFVVLLVSLTFSGTAVDFVMERLHKVCKGCVLEVLMCFSLRRNLKKLFGSYKHDAALSPISGMKVICIVAIIYGHRNIWTLLGPLDNASFNEENYNGLNYAIQLSGYMVVDTFFLITGYLLFYMARAESRRFNSVASILYILIRRYIRLTPVYMLVVAILATTFATVGSGPIWNSTTSTVTERCTESWWIHALYLNNIINPGRMCFIVSWYLASDMQLFIVSVPVVYLLINRPKIGKAVLGILLVASLGIPFFIIYYYRLQPIIRNYKKDLVKLADDETYKYAYIPSYMRGTPYFIGICAGCFIQHFKANEMKLTQLKANFIIIGALVLGWLPTLTSMVFFQKDYKYNALSAAIFAVFQRVSWGMAFSGVVFVFAARKEWSIIKFLSWKRFVPLSRLTYSAYLLHSLPHMYSHASIRGPRHMTSFYLTQQTIADCVITFLMAFVASMLLEAPLINLEKLVFGNGGTTADDSVASNQSINQKCIKMGIDETPLKGNEKSKELAMKVRHLS